MKHIQKLCIALALVLVAQWQLKAQNTGSGANGPLLVTGTHYTDNTRASITNMSYGPSVITATISSTGGSYNASSFSPGTRALIMIMYQKGGTMPTRNWQIMTVTNRTGNNISFASFPSTNWPTSSMFAAGNCKMQLIAVEQRTQIEIFSGGNLTCRPWNGYTGGVVCILANDYLQIQNGGWIDVAAKGYYNPNAAGTGGSGGIGGSIPSPNPVGSGGEPGEAGLITDFSYAPPGQCDNSTGLGGTGGFQYYGTFGYYGSTPETRGNFGKPVPPKLLFPGNGGAQGRGGRGGSGGGSGGNGGNGGSNVYSGTQGTGGTNGMSGGNGGDGGTGGGTVIILANNIYIPHGNKCIDISGSNAGDGTAGIPGGGDAGDGGNGGDGGCDYFPNSYIGFGGMGVRGQRGNGSSGGNGGNGGSIGSFSIRCLAGQTNDLVKSNHVKYNPGLKGAGGAGATPLGASGTNGIDGYPHYNASPLCQVKACTRKIYDTYDWACYEAYQVLGDMDVAVDRGYYIEFTKKSGSSARGKKTGNSISTANADYYCLYFKCSKLLMAFEENGSAPVKVDLPDRNGVKTYAYTEVKNNIYWCKLDDNNSGACLQIHSIYKNDINLPVTFLGYTASAFATSVPLGTPTLFYDFGEVKFGNNSGGPKFSFLDNVNKVDGVLTDLASGTTCNKANLPFNFEWTRAVVCYTDASDPGTGGGNPASGSYEIPPRLPFVDKLWDTPQPGEPGKPGDDGEGDDTYFEGGDVSGGGDDEAEFLGLSDAIAANNSISLTPNPAKNALTIQFKNGYAPVSNTVTITDVTGKVCFTNKDIPSVNNQLTIDISKLHTGIYFIKLESNNSNQLLKFVKE